MLKATPSRIPLNKLKTKNRKNKFKTLWEKNRYSKIPRYTKISFTIGSQDCKIKRSKVLTIFTQLSRSLNVRTGAPIGSVPQNICSTGQFLLAGRFGKNNMSLEGKCSWEGQCRVSEEI